MKILLLDMDSVLLEPHGYHSALIETVRLVGQALGFEEIRLTTGEIAAFESAGVFSEWDSSAICAVLLLLEAWNFDPDLRLPQSINHARPPIAGLKRPDFAGFAERLIRETNNSQLPLERARAVLESADRHRAAHQEAIRQILSTARALPGSLTHRTFQELVLGSQVFANVYGVLPALNTDSYLLQFDLPLISKETRAALLAWLNSHQRAVIMTSRPSEPLAGAFSTPEAELGARLLGLDEIPIVGLGGLNWLSEQTGAPPQSYLKPGPVHALAALARAAGAPLDESLRMAAGLVNGQVAAPWHQIEAADICVFEDNTAGLISAQSATHILSGAGISTRLELYGITENEIKATALREPGARVFPSINAALRQAGVF